MLLILSGEGGSDLGGSSEFGERVGPMAHVVDQLIEERIGYSPLAYGMVEWVSRAELSVGAKNIRSPRIALPGAKRGQGQAGHYKHAQALGILAKRREGDQRTPTVAVMFRDSDGTHASGPRHWQEMVDAIGSGFAAAEYLSGVTMVPKPKQESWLLCALKADPYCGCQVIENESGNDNSPQSLKAQLRDACGFDPSVEDMCEWVLSRRFDVERIDMQSFSHFRDSLAAAVVVASAAGRTLD